MQSICNMRQSSLHNEYVQPCLSLEVGNTRPSVLPSELASTWTEASSGRLCMIVPSLLLLLHILFHMHRLHRLTLLMLGTDSVIGMNCIPSCSLSGLCKPRTLPNSVKGVKSSSQMAIIPKRVNQGCNLQSILDFLGSSLSAVTHPLPRCKEALSSSVEVAWFGQKQTAKTLVELP